MNITPTVKQLLIINVIFFIGSQVLGEKAYDLFSLYFFENDKFQVLLDGTEVYKIDGDDPECDNNAYQEYRKYWKKYKSEKKCKKKILKNKGF